MIVHNIAKNTARAAEKPLSELTEGARGATEAAIAFWRADGCRVEAVSDGDLPGTWSQAFRLILPQGLATLTVSNNDLFRRAQRRAAYLDRQAATKPKPARARRKAGGA